MSFVIGFRSFMTISSMHKDFCFNQNLSVLVGEASDGEQALEMISQMRAATDIISCIKAVAAGQNYTSPELTTYLVNRARTKNSRPGPLVH